MLPSRADNTTSLRPLPGGPPGQTRALPPGSGGEDPPGYPAVGDQVEDCLLLHELGRGGEGRVYLAAQATLDDRPIVLKFTPLRGREHLALARVVHTHVAPLLFVRDLPDAGLRVLAMPYVGGAPLGEVLSALAAGRGCLESGRDVFEVLDRLQEGRPAPGCASVALRQRLCGVGYATLVAWVGAALADALAHAHERGLLHLDLKPGNILLAADGLPLLLDFHLAQPALAPGSLPPEAFGGTWGYMAPEQGQAGTEFRLGRRNSVAVDARADLYGLGAVLFEMITGELPGEGTSRVHRQRLRQARPDVSAGLAAILARCLERDPAGRYGSAADLADDLRRHLSHRPLRGVPDRDLGERWSKWRRRHPGGLARLALASLTLGTVVGGVALAGWAAFEQHRAVAEAVIESGQLTEGGDLAGAARLLERTPTPWGWPGAGSSSARLLAAREAARERLAVARHVRDRERLASDLARLANDLRLGWDVDRLTTAQAWQLDERCARLWGRRRGLRRPACSPGERDDLLELILVRGVLQRRSGATPEDARRQGLLLLDEAEAFLGPSPTLAAERARLRTGSLPEAATAAAGSPGAWGHYWEGRLLLREGRAEPALARFVLAGELSPDAFWPSFYRGVCSHRLGRHGEAEHAFRVCLALMPRSAEVTVNRAVALAALGREAAARASLERALALDPALGAAWLQRGVLHARAKRWKEAVADLERAVANGEEASGHYHLAVVYHERGERVRAADHLARALAQRPDDARALRLRRRLEAGDGAGPRK